MASSQFWQELARQFELIPDQGMLRADGQYTVGSGGPWSWHLAWRGSEFVRNTFETLASRCAFEIAPPGTTDLMIAWLEAIRQRGINFHPAGQVATEVNIDGSKGPNIYLAVSPAYVTRQPSCVGGLQTRNSKRNLKKSSETILGTGHHFVASWRHCKRSRKSRADQECVYQKLSSEKHSRSNIKFPRRMSPGNRFSLQFLSCFPITRL